MLTRGELAVLRARPKALPKPQFARWRTGAARDRMARKTQMTHAYGASSFGHRNYATSAVPPMRAQRPLALRPATVAGTRAGDAVADRAVAAAKAELAAAEQCTAGGGGSQRVADALESLGQAYVLQGRFHRAEPAHARALRMREAPLGASHPVTIKSVSALCATYHATGDVVRAMPLAERLRDLRASQRVDKVYQSL